MQILGFSAEDLEREFRRRYKKGAFHARAAYSQIMQKGDFRVRDLAEFLPAPNLARQFETDICTNLPQIIHSTEAAGTIKFLSRLEDGEEIESVIIPMHSYATVCVSSQVGCRMGCVFCSTAKKGLKRNLAAHEIVAQVYLARFHLQRKIRNVVFMGMGEPLDNFNEVVQAIRVLSDQRGLNIPRSKITLSTAGKLKELTKLGKMHLSPLRIAISLHACEDELRNRLMPLNYRYPLSELKKTLLAYPLQNKEVFFIEYILLHGINDSPEQADKLAEFVQGLPVRINLILYNPDKKEKLPFQRPTDKNAQSFADRLRIKNIFVRIRWSKGDTIAAACGQLRT